MTIRLEVARRMGGVQFMKSGLLLLMAVMAVVLLVPQAWHSPLISQIQAKALSQETDVITTTLSPSGFSPSQLSHAPGRFDLKVVNESGQQQIDLRVKDASGERIAGTQISSKVRVWVGQLDLAPGAYVLSEATHPGWTCSITVTAP